jgi:hypothetical protein
MNGWPLDNISLTPIGFAGTGKHGLAGKTTDV